MDEGRQSVGRVAVQKDIELHELGFLEADYVVVK